MQRGRFKLRPRSDEKPSRKRSPKKRRRQPGLQKQKRLRRSGEKRRFDIAGAIGLPRLTERGKKQQPQRGAQATGSTRRRSSGKSMLQSVRDRKRRMQLRPITNTTFNVRRIAASTRLVSLTLLLLCIYAVWQIGNNPRFYLSRIEIDGATILQRSDIVRNSGVFGTHVFAIEPHVAAEQINAMPGVKSAQVDLLWPDRLHITIEEEAPVLNWRENGRDYWVNASGTLIPAFGQDMSLLTIVADVPEVVQPAVTQLVYDAEQVLKQIEYDELGKPVGDYYDADGDLLEIPARKITYLDFVPPDLTETALRLKREVPEIEQLIYAPGSGLQFWDSRGWIAKFGTGGDLTVKLNIYEAIVSNTQARGIVPEYINVAHPTKPVFKPLSGYTPPAEVQESG